ncbi:MAG: acylphosphatase [Gemmatimonadaceae bacterium]|nr:acylphosphatase [Gemmatimonadaceae bacterium]
MLIRSYVVEGVVQGVGFRWFTREQARRRGLRGWVRNEPDGTVRAVAAGLAGILDEFEAVLQEGPAGSRVDLVRVEPAGPSLLEDLPLPFAVMR